MIKKQEGGWRYHPHVWHNDSGSGLFIVSKTLKGPFILMGRPVLECVAGVVRVELATYDTLEEATSAYTVIEMMTWRVDEST